MTVVLYRAAADRVRVGGEPTIAIYRGAQGGQIVNPLTAADQGLAAAEVLFVDMVGEATLGEGPTTFPLQPGQSWSIPENPTTDVTVNAASTGHRFSAYIVQPPTPYPPTLIPGAFPPSGPVTVLGTIPSYLYQQYNDDADLAAFVLAFNELAQEILDWLNDIDLPIYTRAQISGLLLDWVAAGLYGIVRPALSSGQNRDIGTLNTFQFNVLPYNTRQVIGPTDVVATTDDIYKRIMTWRLYKGDGRVFWMRWLKRRVMRFLLGESGSAPNIDQTYQISVTFGIGNQVTINLIQGRRTITGGALYNWAQFNAQQYNGVQTEAESLPALPNADILAQAIESGAVELPFQFRWIVNVVNVQ